MKRRTILIMSVTCVLVSGTASAAKTTFGSTNANQCYRESNMPLSGVGIRYCTQAIREDDLVIRDLAATYTNRGIIYAANGKLAEALEDHNQAILLSPEMGKIYINRGNVFHQTHEYEKALTDYRKAVELGNVAGDIAYYNMALTLIRLKRWDDARESLEKALEINPDSDRVRRKLAQFDVLREKPTPAVVRSDDSLERIYEQP